MNKPLFTKNLKAYSSQVMQLNDMGLCIYVHILNELYGCQVSDGYLVKQASRVRVRVSPNPNP